MVQYANRLLYNSSERMVHNKRRESMAAKPHGRQSATATINPHNQKLENVQNIVRQILGRAGCEGCGRVALLRIDLQGDPGPELGKQGVVSLEIEGF